VRASVHLRTQFDQHDLVLLQKVLLREELLLHLLRKIGLRLLLLHLQILRLGLQLIVHLLLDALLHDHAVYHGIRICGRVGKG
jgi:hypothetical protein